MKESDSMPRPADASCTPPLSSHSLETLMDSWESYIETSVSASQANGPVTPDRSSAHARFRQEVSALEAFAQLRRTSTGAKKLAELCPGVGLVLSQSGRVLAMNTRAQARFQLYEVSHLSQLDIDPDTVERILSWATAPLSRHETKLLVSCRMGTGQKHSNILLAQIRLPQAGTRHAQPAILASTTDLEIDSSVGQALMSGFGLSTAEAHIAICLGNGLSPGQIATERDSSINTIRTQIKSILKKLNANGIPDLVRILCGFAANQSVNATMHRSIIKAMTPNPVRHRNVTNLPDGRRLAYLEQGAPNGRPVLVFHDMLQGVELTQACAEACRRRNWRVITFSRSGFGDSDSLTAVEGEQLLASTCEDAAWLLSSLGIPSALVIGHGSGSVFADHFCRHSDAQVRGLLLLSQAFFRTDAFAENLPRCQRLLARSARYCPDALPGIARAAAALIDSGRTDLLLQSLYGNNTPDTDGLKRRDVREAVTEGLLHAFRQGTAACCAELSLLAQDRERTESRGTMPNVLAPGEGETVLSHEQTDRHTPFSPTARETGVPQAGQLVLHTHWPKVLERLAMLDRT